MGGIYGETVVNRVQVKRRREERRERREREWVEGRMGERIC